MLSSISSSKPEVHEKIAASSSFIRPGFERPIPAISWLQILIVVAASTFVFVFAWELEMRHLGLHSRDFNDGRGDWAVERRKVDLRPSDSVVLIGDSRILFDTDLATWQKLTGHRPIQLGLMGTNAAPILHDLANDQHFAGLLVIGTAEFSYFGDDGNAVQVLTYVKTESSSQRVGHWIYKGLSRHLAFLDSNYTLFTLLERHNWPERKGVDGPYTDVWKISESYDDRQSYLWDRIERDDYLRIHAQNVWLELFAGPAVKPHEVNEVILSTKTDIDRIRARGGEVVWVRPPSSGPLLDLERVRYPRREVWDMLMHETGSFGIYFEDYPTMRGLRCADWSHLAKASAITFTDSYVRVLREHVGWLRAHSRTEFAHSRPIETRNQVSSRPAGE